MANRFQNFLDVSLEPIPSPTNRFSDFIEQSTTNRFSNLINKTGTDSLFIPRPGEVFTPAAQQVGKKVVNLFGGALGWLGRALNIGTNIQVTGVEKILEKKGILKPIEKEPVVQITEPKSNIELLKRIGEEKFSYEPTESTFVNFLHEVPRIATGRYEPTTSVFSNFTKELPVTAIGLAGDLFLDPTVILGKMGLIAKTTKKVGTEIKTVVKEFAKDKPAVQTVGERLGRGFITRFGQREPFREIDITRKIQENLIADDIGKIVSDVIERPAVIQQRIGQIIKGGITSNEELRALAIPIREELDRVGQSISNLNPKLLNPKTFEANKGTYFPRLYTKYEFPTEGEKAVEQMFSPRAVSVPKERFKQRLTDLEFAQSIDKSITGKSDPELIKRLAEQARAQMGEIKEAGLPAAKGLLQLRVVEERQKMFNEISKMASEEPLPGWTQLSDDKALGNLAGKFLPAAEYRAIAELRRVPTELEAIYSKALALWKTSKTAYNPSTITRNDLTNFFVLNPLGGVGPHRLDIYAGAINDLMTQSPLYQLARREGLNLTTQSAAELKTAASKLYKENKGLFNQFFSKIQDVHHAVVNFYGTQDKFFKMANFRKGVLEDALTPKEAMRRANFYLVDYSEVPEGIAWARKSPLGVPFISFTYGVSKPLAKTLLERPDKLAAYFKILNAFQNMDVGNETSQDIAAEQKVLPEWIQEGMYLRLPWKDKYGRGQYVNLQYILPFNILETRGLMPSSPALTILAALFYNKNSFTGKDIWLNTDTEEERATKESRYILQQLIPSMAPFGYSFDKIKAMIQGRPDVNGFVREALPVLIDVLGGIKITPIDPTVEAQKRATQKRKELEELKGQLRRIYLDKTLFPKEKEKLIKPIQEKINLVFPE